MSSLVASSAESAVAEAPGSALARNAAFLLGAQVISTALAVVFSAALGRALGPAEFGLYYLASSMAGFAYVVVEWGQSQYVVRELAQHPDREGGLLGTTLALRLGGGLAGALVTAAIAAGLGYDARTCVLAAALVVAMLPFFLAQGVALVFRSRERMEFDALGNVADKSVTLLAVLGFLAVGTAVFGAAAGLLSGGLVSLLASWLLLRHIGVPRLSFSREHARAMMVGGAAILLTNVETSIQPYIDAIVLSRLAPSASELGWYGAARTFVGTLVAPSIILSVAAFPRLSRASLDPGLLRHELHVVLRPLVGLGVLACVGTYLLAPQAVHLVYGENEYEPAVIILQLMAPGLFLLFLDNLLAGAVVAVGRPRPLAIAKLVNIAACTGLALWLVPVFEANHGNGGMGLAVASGVSEIIMFAAAVIILPRGSLAPSLLADAGRALVAGGITLALFLNLPALPLWAGVPLCIAVFTGLALALGLVRPAELLALPQMVRRKA